MKTVPRERTSGREWEEEERLSLGKLGAVLFRHNKEENFSNNRKLSSQRIK